LKRELKKSIQEINEALLDTLAACGDVNRNVMCNPNPIEPWHDQVYDFAKRLSQHLLPNTSAYHEIWLDKKLVKSEALQDFEPLYGSTYLPRKFKAAIAVPPNNDVDVFAHDLGYIAIFGEHRELIGFNVSIGGGMGMTHGNKKTYPKLGELLGFCTPEQAIEIGEKVMLVQRDYGERLNRKHARLKYTLDDRGIEWYRKEVEERLGYKLMEPRPYHFTDNGDRYGWQQGPDGKWHYTFFIQNGRIKDFPNYPLRTALGEIAKIHQGDIRLTPNQNFILSKIPNLEKERIEALMNFYKIGNKQHSGLRLNSMACVALPTCGLAFSESERYLPSLVTLLEEEVEKTGLRDQPITIRMTGCPNGCARPYVAEIGLVGKALGIYNLYLGGGHSGERLNKLFKEAVNEEEILSAMKPVIAHFAKERHHQETFGDFVIRAGYVKEVKAGKDFHDSS